MPRGFRRAYPRASQNDVGHGALDDVHIARWQTRKDNAMLAPSHLDGLRVEIRIVALYLMSSSRPVANADSSQVVRAQRVADAHGLFRGADGRAWRARGPCRAGRRWSRMRAPRSCDTSSCRRFGATLAAAPKPGSTDRRGRVWRCSVERSHAAGELIAATMDSSERTLAHGAVVSAARLGRISRCAPHQCKVIWFGHLIGHAVQT